MTGCGTAVEADGGLFVARAELVLARPDHRPLRAVGLDPDPMQSLAAAFAGVRSDEGEVAELVVDLLPVGGAAVARRRRRLVSRAGSRGPSVFGERVGGGPAALGGLDRAVGTLAEGLNGGRPASGGGPGAGRVPRSSDVAWEVGKFAPTEAPVVFACQVLARVVAVDPGRAGARLQQILAVLELWAGENWWRPVGPRRGPWGTYSNVWWRRSSFDRRIERGDFAPAQRGQWVTAREIGALLKPPTARCSAVNVLRGGGAVPAAPAALPTWSGQAGVVPLGWVTGADGQQRLAGLRQEDLLFGASLGKSGFGKTEQALVQALACAFVGFGVWFLDPHGAALERARPYMTHPQIAQRLWEIDLSTPGMDQAVACWNPLSMEGRREEEIQEVVGSVVGALATTQGWGETAPRARTILSNAVRTLAELSWRLVKDGQLDLQPTIFQIRTLLTNEEWREQVLAHLPADVTQFWRTAFVQYDASAVPTVTNAIDRLEASLSLRAFLGWPRSGYDVRRAMDTSRVVCVCPSGTGEADDMITALLIFDLFRAGLSRRNLPPEKMRTLFAWMDELTAIDGASRGNVARILEQLRKYEVRLMAMTQMAMRLSESTRQALLQNQSVLSITAADVEEAAFVAKRMPGISPQTLMGLTRYEYLVTAMINGSRSAPFRVRGVPVDEVYADYYDPDGVEGLRQQVDANLQRRTVREILQRQRTLEVDIRDHLAGRRRTGAEHVEVKLPAAGAARGARR